MFLSEGKQPLRNHPAYRAGVPIEYRCIQPGYHSYPIGVVVGLCGRFYHRQFITRKIAHHKILDKLEAFLATYFDSDDLVKRGLPSVQDIAAELNVSPNYLSVLLKVLTGQGTQQHIHDKLIARAKEKLSTTDLSVSEIAYALGFEHPQSFSKLFKTKTNLSPAGVQAIF